MDQKQIPAHRLILALLVGKEYYVEHVLKVTSRALLVTIAYQREKHAMKKDLLFMLLSILLCMLFYLF